MTNVPWLVARSFGPWRVEALLAEGGMATIWAVRHLETDAAAALKVSRSRDPELLARVTREGQIQRALRHPNVLGVLDEVEVEGVPGLVLELVEGGLTLEHHLAEGPLAPAELDALVAGLLDGVEVAHRAGFIHRDLKPANVLLQRSARGWTPRVADFGLARPEFEPPDAKLTRAGFILGSAAYMAPEQARDAGSVDARADLWSLGAMIYEMVGGVPPFSGETVEEVLQHVTRARFRPLDSVVPDVAARWQVAVEACLHVDPTMRVPDVATLREVIAGRTRWVSLTGGAGRTSLPGVAAPRASPARKTPIPEPISTSGARPAAETFAHDTEPEKGESAERPTPAPAVASAAPSRRGWVVPVVVALFVAIVTYVLYVIGRS